MFQRRLRLSDKSVIDLVRGQDGWILAKTFFLRVY